MPTIWVPSPGRGADNGHRYRDALHTLDTPEIIEAHDVSLLAIERYAGDPGSDLGEWTDHAPALSVYNMWAIYALKEHGVIGAEDVNRRLKLVAELQRVIAYGRAAGWLAPSWWGSDAHRQHQRALIARDPDRYTVENFR
ncbi:hypothetical protein EB73_07270 [Mycobacterium sp. SWH-M3]|nr:hypothetical protein EB73_07270 [Mycobacterium sp. SWH-M3]